MLSEKLVNSFVETYKANYDVGRELEDSLLEPVAYEEWLSRLQIRSKTIRQNFETNEKYIGEIKSALKEPLSEDEAQYLYNAVLSLYDDAYDDFCIIKMLAEPAITVFEQEKNIEKLVFLYHVLGFESFEFAGRTLGEKGSLEAVSYFEKVVEFQDHYTEIESERVRKCFFTAYNNMIAPIAQVVPEMRPHVFEIYRKAYELWERDEVQKLDGGKEEFVACFEQIDEDMLFMEEYVNELDEQEREQFLEFIERLKDNLPEDYTNDSGSWYRAYSVYKIMKGEIDIRDSISEGIDYLLNLELPDYNDDPYVTRSRLMNFHNTACSILSQLKHSKLPREEQEKYLDRFVYKVTAVHTHVPYQFFTGTVNQLCGEWYKDVSEFLPGLESKKDCLQRLIICRQPTTYIHSLMVTDLATVIASNLIEVRPEMFVGILGASDEAEVRTKHDEIIEHIRSNAMLHDVGKCCIVEIISTQNRRLFDEEFKLIKAHPELGIGLLGDDKDFLANFDCIIGHHVTYDRQNGYPAAVTSEGNLIVRDIVSIADSMDAATDILGRNYTSGKSFARLQSELVEGAGTVYNPEVVKSITDDETLRKKLEYMTTEGRYQTYYKAFRDILDLEQ